LGPAPSGRSTFPAGQVLESVEEGILTEATQEFDRTASKDFDSVRVEDMRRKQGA